MSRSGVLKWFGKLLIVRKTEKRQLLHCPRCGCALGNGVMERGNGKARIIGYCPRHGYIEEPVAEAKK